MDETRKPMNKSETVAQLMSALAKAQAEFPDVPKTKEVVVQSQKGAYTFKYAPLEKMIAIIRPVLAKYGLGFTQGAIGESLVTTIFHESGEWMAHSMPLPDLGTAQAYGSQFTYRRRYSLKAALGIETDDDNSEEDHSPKAKGKGALPSGPITANGDAMNHVAPERKEYVQRVASTIVDCFNAQQPQEAFKAYKSVTENDEKLGVWSFLDSKMRSSLKKMGQDERLAEKV